MSILQIHVSSIGRGQSQKVPGAWTPSCRRGFDFCIFRGTRSSPGVALVLPPSFHSCCSTFRRKSRELCASIPIHPADFVSPGHAFPFALEMRAVKHDFERVVATYVSRNFFHFNLSLVLTICMVERVCLSRITWERLRLRSSW